MSSKRSVISDLYGVGTTRPKPCGGLGLIALTLLGGMFLYESVHPVMRLRSRPAFSSTTAAARGSQGSAAQSYWNLATNFVSARYSYGELLPDTPPKDFTTAVGGNYSTSSIYWQEVRGVWNQRGSWIQSYRLDTDWIYSAVGSLYKVVRNYINS